MRRRTLPTIALLALLAAGLLWWGRTDDQAGGGDVRDTGPAAQDDGQAPRLKVRDRPPPTESSDLAPPMGAAPDPLDDAEERIDPDQTRIRGVVRLRGTKARARSGRVELFFIRPDDWPGSWDAVRRLTERKEAPDHVEHHADIQADGTWQTDVTRGVYITRTRVRPAHMWRPELSNFIDTKAPAEIHVVGERFTLDLEADPGIRIAGRVIDARTGAPVEGARIMRATRFGMKAGGVSETDGTVLVSGLRPKDIEERRPLEFRVRHPEYVTATVLALYDRASESYGDLTVRLARGVRVAGVVRMDGKKLRHPVGLCLLQRGGARAPLGKEPEQLLAQTRTDDTGRFQFPPIAPIPDATLHVPPSGSWMGGGGAGHEIAGLDLRTNREDLVIELTSVVHAYVRPYFPSGTLATWKQSQTVIQDALGHWRRSFTRGTPDDPVWRVALKPGHAHRITVWAERKEEDGTKQLYRGGVVVRVQSPEEAARGVSVNLAPFEPPAIPENRERPVRVGLNDGQFGHYVWQLQIRDAATGRPLGGRQAELATNAGSMSSVGLPEDAVIRLRVAMGRMRVRISVEGYEPLEVILEPTEPGYAEAVVELQPLDG